MTGTSFVDGFDVHIMLAPLRRNIYFASLPLNSAQSQHQSPPKEYCSEQYKANPAPQSLHDPNVAAS